MAIYAKHKEDNPDSKYLPLTYHAVYYTGERKYSSPRELWELFPDKELAKKLFTDPYDLIEVHKIDDEVLKANIYSGIMQLIMKRVIEKDILPYLQEIKSMLKIIGHENFDYIKTIMHYTMNKAETANKENIIELFQEVVEEEKRNDIMTIAEQLRAEGFQNGIQQGIERGIQQGLQRAMNQVVLNMLKEGQPVEYISRITGLEPEEVKKLQAKTN